MGFRIRMNTLSSVFRDRSEIIKQLDSNKFEKYLIINKKVDLNQLAYPLKNFMTEFYIFLKPTFLYL